MNAINSRLQVMEAIVLVPEAWKNSRREKKESGSAVFAARAELPQDLTYHALP